MTIEPFRVLPGDDTSCLNLYEPTNPRILGVSRRFIDAGRFAFQASLGDDRRRARQSVAAAHRAAATDGAIPVAADANSMTYVLHKSLGDEIVLTHGDQPIRLRLVAALADSVFQGELLMSEANFVRLFPEQQGYRFLLVDAPAGSRGRDRRGDRERRRPISARTPSPTPQRLAEFHAVENTYLSTFQTLGGLGLLVGTVGLAAVLLRNVLERRRELALLRAVGYGRRHLFAIIAVRERGAARMGAGGRRGQRAGGHRAGRARARRAAADDGGRLAAAPCGARGGAGIVRHRHAGRVADAARGRAEIGVTTRRARQVTSRPQMVRDP